MTARIAAEFLRTAMLLAVLSPGRSTAAMRCSVRTDKFENHRQQAGKAFVNKDFEFKIPNFCSRIKKRLPFQTARFRFQCNRGAARPIRSRSNHGLFFQIAPMPASQNSLLSVGISLASISSDRALSEAHCAFSSLSRSNEG